MNQLPTTIQRMQVYQPCFMYDEEPGKWPKEFDWESNVAVVDRVAAYIACPDCIDSPDLPHRELLTLDWFADADGYAGVRCNLCKDTGKLWVSI